MTDDPIAWMRRQTTILRLQREANEAARRNQERWTMIGFLWRLAFGHAAG